MSRMIAALAAATLVASPALTANAPSLIGAWFGEGFQPSGEYTQWIDVRRADQTYLVEFHVFSDCRRTGTLIESGTWRFDGQRLLDTTLKVNGKATDASDSYYRNYYHVTWVDASHIAYIEEASGTKYEARRVTADFAFPPCKQP